MLLLLNNTRKIEKLLTSKLDNGLKNTLILKDSKKEKLPKLLIWDLKENKLYKLQNKLDGMRMKLYNIFLIDKFNITYLQFYLI